MAENTRGLKSLILLVAVFYVSLIFLTPFNGHPFDINCWEKWSVHIFENGLGNAYEGTTNYNPFYLYILKFFTILQGSEQKIHENIFHLKYLNVFFDLSAIILLGWFLVKKNIDPHKALLILLNVAYLYNTVIWGQVDAIYTTFVFAAFLALFYKLPVIGIMMFLLALNMKLQAVIFLPLFLLVLLPLFREKPYALLYGLVSVILVQLILLLPFLLEGEGSKVTKNIFGSVGYYPYVSMNAFNFWHLVMEGDLMRISDQGTFAGLSYRMWGMIMFTIIYAMLFLPAAVKAINRLIQKNVRWGNSAIGLIFLTLGLLSLVFFYFPTEMHERYIHPVIMFLGIYAIVERKYLIYILVSAGYVLNLEKVLQSLELNNYETFIFQEEFIASIFLSVLILGSYRLYKQAEVYQEWKVLYNQVSLRLRNK